MPATQESPAQESLTRFTLADGVTAKVLCGEVDGVRGRVENIATQPEYLDVTVPSNTCFRHTVPQHHTGFAYVIQGTGDFGVTQHLTDTTQLSDGSWRDVEYGPWADSKQQLSPNVVQAFRGVGHGWLGDAFARIQIPVLVLKQDMDEAGKQQDQSVVSLIHGGQLVHVPGAGHNIRRDRYDETVVILKRFLSDLSSGSD